MTEILDIITRLAALVFFLSSMSGTGLGLTIQQIVDPLRKTKLVALA